MSDEGLKELYIEELKDIYNAAKRLDRKLEAVRKRVADEHIPATGRERQ